MRTFILGAIGAAVIVVSLTACQLGEWRGEEGAPSVSVIGDSLVYHAEGNYDASGQRILTDELAASGYRAHVSGYIGETVQLAYERLWPAVADEPDLDTLVIALGNNDIANDLPLETSRAALRQWLVEAAGTRCVALVGVNVQATAWRMDIFGPAFNEMLAEEAALHHNAIYVAWHPDLDIHGHTGDVHMPTAEGQAQYRATLRGAVEQCAATTPATSTR